MIRRWKERDKQWETEGKGDEGRWIEMKGERETEEEGDEEKGRQREREIRRK